MYELQIRCGQSVYAKRERDLASVMQVMLDHMPDDPLAREGILFALPRPAKDVIQVGRSIAGQAFLHER